MGKYLGETKVRRSAYAVDRSEPLFIYIGTCEAHDRPVRVDMSKDFGSVTFIPCPEGDQVKGYRLNAIETTLECDGSCMAARGSECVCGCGGINHGLHWMNRQIALMGGTHFVTGAILDSQEVTDTELEKWRVKQRKVEAAREARTVARQRRDRVVFEQWADLHADLMRFLAPWRDNRDDEEWQKDTGAGWGAHILVEFADQVYRDEPRALSERQVELAFRILREATERKTKREERKANASPCPEGRVTVKGRIRKIKASEGYSFDQVRHQMIVDSDDGYSVMCTLPTVIASAAYRATASSTLRPYGDPDYYAIGERLTGALKGAVIEFSATVQRSAKDETFGFGKRPSRVSWDDSQIQ